MNPVRAARTAVGVLLGAQAAVLRRLGLADDSGGRTRVTAEREAAAIVAEAEREAEAIRRNARTTAEGIVRLAEEDRRDLRRDAG